MHQGLQKKENAAERSHDAAAQSKMQPNTYEPLFVRLYFVFFFHNRFYSPVQK